LVVEMLGFVVSHNRKNRTTGKRDELTH
jgi:hypothetical protein